jgi:hypothetical protein
MPPVPDITPRYLYPHAAANEAVPLHEGPVTVRDTGKPAVEGTGTLVLRWVPAAGLRLDAELTPGWMPDTGVSVEVDIAGSVAKTLVNQVSIGVNEGVPFARISGSVSTFEKGSGADLTVLGFQVVNFVDFLTPGPKPAPVFGYPPHVADLHYDGWRIRLSVVGNSQQVFKSLGETGGYAFTHLGQLERADGATFSAQQAEGVLDALVRFLRFARGAACNLAVRWGIDQKGDVVWKWFNSPVVDPWKGRDSWFDEHHGNLLSEIFPEFARTFADPDLHPPFSLALHWYEKSHTRAGGMEGAIILGLTALDLLGALVVVDRAGAMSASKYDGLTAAKKLAALLETIKVPATIPAQYSNLAGFATTQGWADASVTLAEIRHGYVHSNKKRRTVVLSAPKMATFEAWRLSLWYQELALLFLLNHRGEYRNRVTAGWLGQVETVPWA